MLERFFHEECEFGPKLRVTKKDLYRAYEQWCDAEGEAADSQAKFTKEVGKRGVVKKFAEGKYNGTRTWNGIGLAERPPSDDESAPTQKSWKQRGRSTNLGHLKEDSTNSVPENVYTEGFGENGPEVPQVPQSGITPPWFGEVDGIPVEYRDAREESK